MPLDTEIDDIGAGVGADKEGTSQEGTTGSGISSVGAGESGFTKSDDSSADSEGCKPHCPEYCEFINPPGCWRKGK